MASSGISVPCCSPEDIPDPQAAENPPTDKWIRRSTRCSTQTNQITSLALHPAPTAASPATSNKVHGEGSDSNTTAQAVETDVTEADSRISEYLDTHKNSAPQKPTTRTLIARLKSALLREGIRTSGSNPSSAPAEDDSTNEPPLKRVRTGDPDPQGHNVMVTWKSLDFGFFTEFDKSEQEPLTSIASPESESTSESSLSELEDTLSSDASQELPDGPMTVAVADVRSNPPPGDELIVKVNEAKVNGLLRDQYHSESVRCVDGKFLVPQKCDG